MTSTVALTARTLRTPFFARADNRTGTVTLALGRRRRVTRPRIRDWPRPSRRAVARSTEATMVRLHTSEHRALTSSPRVSNEARVAERVTAVSLGAVRSRTGTSPCTIAGGGSGGATDGSGGGTVAVGVAVGGRRRRGGRGRHRTRRRGRHRRRRRRRRRLRGRRDHHGRVANPGVAAAVAHLQPDGVRSGSRAPSGPRRPRRRRTRRHRRGPRPGARAGRRRGRSTPT